MISLTLHLEPGLVGHGAEARVSVRPPIHGAGDAVSVFDGALRTPLFRLVFTGRLPLALPRPDRWEVSGAILPSPYHRVPLVVVRCGWLGRHADTPVVYTNRPARPAPRHQDVDDDSEPP